MTDDNTTALGVYEHAASAAANGVAVIPLHWVRDDGRCSCDDPGPDHGPGGKQTGKHPLKARWASGSPLTPADCWTLFTEEYPRANLGFRTGVVSGFFVLDVDPDNGGFDSLAALVAEVGPLDTYTVTTGSGGTHYYFSMPAFPVRNSANRELLRRFGPGLDIRGDGGQVVAPPSTSGKGPYAVASLPDKMVGPAPDALLELMQVVSDVAPAPATDVVEDLPALAELDEATRERVQRYAERVVSAEVRLYQDAAPGSGNSTLFTSAANCLEIAQSPWNSVTAVTVHEALERARLARIDRHPYGGGQTATEFSATWHSAQSRVIGQGRALPPDPSEGVAFTPSPAPTPSTSGVGAGMGVSAADGLGFDVSGLTMPSSAPAEIDAVQALIDEMLTGAEVAERPNPRPLINGVLDLDSEAWIIGAPGSFKTFAVLDIAAHVGRGLPRWQGHRVHQGTVVYVVAEGVSGMTLRTRAWRSEYGELDGVRFLPRPVQARDGLAWQVLVEACRRLEPALVVIDTQARVTVGMEENAATEMGIYVERVGQIRRATGACVLTVHHVGRNGGDARGSSAIDGAQGTELRIERKVVAGRLGATISMDKQKDMADTGSIELWLQRVEAGVDPETGRDLSSLVVAPLEPFASTAAPRPWIDGLPQTQERVVAVLIDHAGVLGATQAQAWGWAQERFGEIKRSTWSTAWSKLAERERIVRVHGTQRYLVPPMLDGTSGADPAGVGFEP